MITSQDKLDRLIDVVMLWYMVMEWFSCSLLFGGFIILDLMLGFAG